MGIGVSVFLAAVGAILYWAVTGDLEGVNLDVIGVILMIAGGIGLVWALVASSALRGRRAAGDEGHVVRRVYEDR